MCSAIVQLTHSKNDSPILVGDFRDEEQQNRLAVQIIEEEVQKLEENIKAIEIYFRFIAYQ